MFSRRLAAAMITVDRPVQYVHQTIQSLEASGFFDHYQKLHVVVGGPDVGYLERYFKDPRFHIHPFPEKTTNPLDFLRMPPRSRCAWAHCRAWKILLEDPSWEEAFVFEDDIVFAANWMAYLCQVIFQIRQSQPAGWMLTLYQHQNSLEYQAGGIRWHEVNSPYCGGLAEIHTRASMQGLPEYIWEHCVLGPNVSDITTGEYLRSNGLRIFATFPSLVNHIGEISVSHVSGFFHRAGLFFDKLVYSQWDEEPFILDFFDKHPPRNRIFCDLGAYNGLVNSNTRALFERGWTGVLVEPNPEMFGWLCRLYKGTNVVLIHAAASGPERAELTLEIPVGSDPYDEQIATGVPSEKERWPYINEWRSVKVPTLGLRDIFARAPGPIDFLSVDCEGMDVEIIEGAGFLPGDDLPMLVMVEHNDNRDQALVRLEAVFRPLGYKLVYKNPINAAWASEKF